MRWGKPDPEGKPQYVLFEKFVIGPADNPYMIRWRLFECPWFRIFLHKICRSDSDRDLHDHPFSFVSIILRGGYGEHRNVEHPCKRCEPFNQCGRVEKTKAGTFVRWYGAGSVIVRKAHQLHRIELASILDIDSVNPKGPWLKIPKPAWTLVIAGRRVRQWGFQTEDGWVNHREYLESW